MKKLLLMLVGAAVIASCTKENVETINDAESPVVMNENERSLSDFAVILSKAINQEPELERIYTE